MASSSWGGGQGNTPRGRGRVSSDHIYIDDEDFTIVVKNPVQKGDGYISSSSSFYKQKGKEAYLNQETLANIVVKEDTDYILKNFSIHVCYIE